MKTALLHKFEQHQDLRDELLKTGKRMLIEHTPHDTYWGDGGDGEGLNRLGKLLMEVRDIMRSKYTSAPSASRRSDQPITIKQHRNDSSNMHAILKQDH